MVPAVPFFVRRSPKNSLRSSAHAAWRTPPNLGTIAANPFAGDYCEMTYPPPKCLVSGEMKPNTARLESSRFA